MLSIALLVAFGCSASPVAAQATYKSDPVNQTLRRHGLTAKRFAKQPTDDVKAKSALGQYVQKYYLPMMTQSDPKSLGDLAKNRSDFYRNFLQGADPSIQKFLTPGVLTIMTRIAQDSGYHPAVRYNAVLTIGMLDSKYSSGNTPPEPLPKANKLLVRIVQQGLEKPAVPASLMTAALIGLERHAGLLKGLPAQNRNETVALLLKVMNAEKMPQDLSIEVEQWLKVIAARGLVKTGSLGESNAIHDALFLLLGNENLSLNNRVRVAALFKQLATAYPTAVGIDEKKTGETLLSLTVAIGADEKEKSKAYEELSLRTGGDFDSEGMPDAFQVRRLIMRLRGLRIVIQAVSPAVQDEPLRGQLAKIVSTLNPILADAEDKNVVEISLAAKVVRMADAFANIASSTGASSAGTEAPVESSNPATEAGVEAKPEEDSLF